MKILVFCINYFPEPTSVGKYTTDMCEWLVEQGHSVSIITAMPYYPDWKVYKNYRGKFWFKEVINGVHIYRTPLYVPKIVTGKTRILHEISFVVNSLIYLPILLFNKFDVWISIIPPLQLSLFAVILSKLKKVPLIIHTQDLQVDAAIRLGLISNSKLIKVLKKLEKKIYLNATALSTISEGMRKILSDKVNGKKKVGLFRNWVDTNKYKPIDAGRLIVKKFGLSSDDKTVLYAGNIGEKQGLDQLLEIAGQCPEKIKFIIAGNGAAKTRLQNKAANMNLKNVIFSDVIPEEEFPEVLSSADLHVIFQKKEASNLVLPSKLGTILSVGGAVLVVADNRSDIYRLIQENDIGFVCEPDNNDHIVELINRILSTDRHEQKVNARKYALKTLRKTHILGDFEKKITEIVTGMGEEN